MRELLKTGSSIFLRRQTHILSAAFVIMSTYAASHLLGLVKTRLLISYFYGSKALLLDVYYAAFLIPDTLFQLLVIGSLSAAFIPVFTHKLHQDRKSAWQLADTTLTMVLAGFTLISIIIFVFAPSFAKIVAPGFSLYQLKTMSDLLRIMLFAQIAFAISGFLTAIIQSQQRFLIPALAPIVYNLGIMIGTLLLSPHYGIYGPALGVVIGAVAHMLIQLPTAVKLGFNFHLNLNFRDSGFRQVFKLIPLRTLTLGIDQIEQFVSVVLASTLIQGSLTILNVARLLYNLPTSLFGATVGQAILPALSQESAKKDRENFSNTLINALLQVTYLALPLSILLIVLRIPVVRLVFGAKTFPWIATITTGKTMAVLAVSAAFTAGMQLIIRAFYALHDTKTPFVIGLIFALVDAGLAILFIRTTNLGVVGLAMAITLTNIVECLVLFTIISVRLKNTIFWDHQFRISVIKITTAAVFMGIFLWLPMRFLDQWLFDTTRTLPLISLTIISGIAGFTVYFLLSLIFKIQELKIFYSLIFRIISWPRLFFPRAVKEVDSSEALIVPAPDQN